MFLLPIQLQQYSPSPSPSDLFTHPVITYAHTDSFVSSPAHCWPGGGNTVPPTNSSEPESQLYKLLDLVTVVIKLNRITNMGRNIKSEITGTTQTWPRTLHCHEKRPIMMLQMTTPHKLFQFSGICRLFSPVGLNGYNCNVVLITLLCFFFFFHGMC